MTKLTVAKIRKLKEPGKYGDGDGLMLRLSAPGKGRWVLRAMIHGKRRDISFGSLEFMSLSEARAEAFQIRKDIEYGRDPAAERKKAKLVIPTFKEAAFEVHNEYKSGWKNGKYHIQWLRTMELYAFPSIGNMLAKDIERSGWGLDCTEQSEGKPAASNVMGAGAGSSAQRCNTALKIRRLLSGQGRFML